MGDITLQQIALGLAFIVGLWASIDTLSKKFTAISKKSLEEALKPTNAKIDELGKKIYKVDSNATKNYLVSRLDDIEKGENLNEAGKERFWEQYEHYTQDLAGNSYIKNRVNKLKNDGLL